VKNYLGKKLNSNKPIRHVGSCTTANEIMVEDIPEMDYYSYHKDANCKLTPRGEICMRG
jgi:hypothetical protein